MNLYYGKSCGKEICQYEKVAEINAERRDQEVDICFTNLTPPLAGGLYKTIGRKIDVVVIFIAELPTLFFRYYSQYDFFLLIEIKIKKGLALKKHFDLDFCCLRHC